MTPAMIGCDVMLLKDKASILCVADNIENYYISLLRQANMLSDENATIEMGDVRTLREVAERMK